ncbi:MAG: NAD(+) synthase [Bacillota bacterium]|jgi:NAD+ synthase (glutamine-hydrolysing)
MFGLIRVGAAAPKLAVADCEYNKTEILKVIDEAYEKGVQVLVFPELCITGSSCGDLFYQKTLLAAAEKALWEIAKATAGKEMFVALGLPWAIKNKIYNVATAVCNGSVLGFVPKTHMCNQKQFAELSDEDDFELWLDGDWYDIGSELIFTAKNLPDLKIALGFGSDLNAPISGCASAALQGANVILSLAAAAETAVSGERCRDRIAALSSSCKTAYVYASAGIYESTQEGVFGGQTVIAENGRILAEGERFALEGSLTIADIDTELLVSERRKNEFFAAAEIGGGLEKSGFEIRVWPGDCILREISPAPFAPVAGEELAIRLENIFTVQYTALARRLLHTHSKTAVVGISGGLDSTLALLVIVKAFDYLGWDRKHVIGVTMPGFGTTDRTYNNALELMKALGITMKEISIVPAIKQHLADIGHDIDNHNVTYENAQARERTQILMDIANDLNGLVIGTGDLSELALGWATYNGDHMSMYGVNGGVPKTVVRLVVDWVSRSIDFGKNVAEILQDVLDTPISPELLPPTSEGEIQQKTEDIVGPYELHDFFLYYVVRCGFKPAKIYAYAKKAWNGVYDNETILKWLKNFYRRFFMQQFKRSCMPDGPLVGSVSLSPRGGWQMPTDACANVWLREVENLQA